MSWRPILIATAVIMPFTMLGACQSSRLPITTAARVDLPRFMGDWYVIANIPTFIETQAYGAMESYRLDSDGTIDTTFTFRKGAFDGPLRRHNPRGFVLDRQSNAVWGMRFVWPIKADYRIVYVSDDYSRTIIGRQARDYVWIMARTPTISDADYQELLNLVAREGYDLGKVRKVPQRPAPAAGP
jgi:apolipoprotein D and lipocalin family protein